jgi:hypothetical protein
MFGFIDRYAELPPSMRIFQSIVLVQINGRSFGVDGMEGVQIGIGEFVFFTILLKEMMIVDGDALHRSLNVDLVCLGLVAAGRHAIR